MTRSSALAVFALAASLASAQNATISRFRFWTADTAYSVYSDTSRIFAFTVPDGSRSTVPTADTMYRHTTAVIEKRLGCSIEKLNVDGAAMEKGPERITGFPERKIKTILAEGKFGLIFEVEVVMYPSWRKSESNKKALVREFEMRVTVESFDGRGNRTGKYMERTPASAVKGTAAWQYGFDRNTGLTGNQIMDFYVLALENAMNTKR